MKPIRRSSTRRTRRATSASRRPQSRTDSSIRTSADDVLLADHLDGEPLGPDHGAPLCMVSPRQYGFMSTKHLSRIELHTEEPAGHYHPSWRVDWASSWSSPTGAPVWHEERHRYLPARIVRPVYRRVVPLIRSLSRR